MYTAGIIMISPLAPYPAFIGRSWKYLHNADNTSADDKSGN